MPTIFTTAYFGNISYYKDLIIACNPEIEINEFYIKQTIRNRMSICSSNGKLDLTIPVKKINGNKTLIKDIVISYEQDWRKDHWRAIESAYKHSAYFEHYGDQIHQLIYQEESNLIVFNENINKKIIEWLCLPISLSFSTEFHHLITNDYRNNFTLNPYKEEYKYYQLFNEKFPFIGNLSIIDAIMNLGPLARKILIPN